MSDEPDLSVVYSGAVDDVLAAADASQSPQSLEIIYDLAVAAGVDNSSVVVDAAKVTTPAPASNEAIGPGNLPSAPITAGS